MLVVISIIFIAIGWILYQTTSHFGNMAKLPISERPAICRDELMVGLLTILNALSVIIFIIASLLLYFSDLSSPLLWWIIIIVSANILGETLMAILFYREGTILFNSILSPLTAIGLILPFWLIAQIHIAWLYKILIMIPVFGVYCMLIFPFIQVIISVLTIPLTFLLYPLILIEKRMRGCE